MELMFPLGFALLFIGASVEMLLYFFGTGTLGRLALLPYGEARSIDLGPAAQEILSGRRAASRANEGLPREGGDYRSPPAPPSAVRESIVAALGYPPKVDADTHLVYADPARDELVVRLPFKFFGSRTYGLVTLKLVFDGQRVQLRGAYLPMPGLSYVAALVVLTAGALLASSVEILILPGALLLGLLINGLISWFRLRGPVDAVRMQLESTLYSLR